MINKFSRDWAWANSAFCDAICGQIKSTESVSKSKIEMNQKRGDSNCKTIWNETNQNELLDMICHNKLNNVEYWQIKMNKFFGLYRKSQFKMNNFFVFVNVEERKNMSKWLKNFQNKNVLKCSPFDSIQQYLTLFDFKTGICFLYKTNRDPIWVLNSKTNTKYFWIIFSIE